MLTEQLDILGKLGGLINWELSIQRVRGQKDLSVQRRMKKSIKDQKKRAEENKQKQEGKDERCGSVEETSNVIKIGEAEVVGEE